MALWDNYADQIAGLPTLAAIDAENDVIGVRRSDGGFSRVLLKDQPWMSVAAMQVSGVGVNPVASTTATDSFVMPRAAACMELGVGCAQAPTASVVTPKFDFLNQATGLSFVDGTTTADPLVAIDNLTTFKRVAAPAVVTASAGQIAEVYCRTAAGSEVLSTWGFFIFCENN